MATIQSSPELVPFRFGALRALDSRNWNVAPSRRLFSKGRNLDSGGRQDACIGEMRCKNCAAPHRGRGYEYSGPEGMHG